MRVVISHLLRQPVGSPAARNSLYNDLPEPHVGTYAQEFEEGLMELILALQAFFDAGYFSA